jgi:hypothetical protein
MTTESQNTIIGQHKLSRVPDFVDYAVGIGVVDGGTSTAPTYSVTMFSIAHPGKTWQATGITPFRTGGEKVPCAAAESECIMRYYRYANKEKYQAFEDELFYECQEPAP